MADDLNEVVNEKISSVDPGAKGKGSGEESPATKSGTGIHIVDVTDEYLGQAFIIAGAQKPKN